MATLLHFVTHKIKLYENQYLRDDIIFETKFEFISLLGNIHMDLGNIIFDDKDEVKEEMICSKIHDISYIADLLL